MVMGMVRKSKVEKSPHFDEIVTRLSKGKSARSVSKWLKNEYNEDISHAALSRYARNYISMEDKVEAELNRRAEEKRKKLEKEKEEAQREEKVQREADKIEAAEETINSVAETIATNMEGVAKVAAQFPDKFEQACRDAEDPESRVTSKDVARLSLEANKLYNEYFKQDETNFEINLNEGFEELEDALKRSRELAEKG